MGLHIDTNIYSLGHVLHYFQTHIFSRPSQNQMEELGHTLDCLLLPPPHHHPRFPHPPPQPHSRERRNQDKKGPLTHKVSCLPSTT